MNWIISHRDCGFLMVAFRSAKIAVGIADLPVQNTTIGGLVFNEQQPRRGHSRNGISLIETVACVAIVASMATAIVGLMQNSVRVAASSRTTSGAPAEARKALRELSDRLQAWDQADGIVSINGRTIRTNSNTYRFGRQTSQTGSGADLILQDDAGNQTTCVLGSFVDLEFIPLPSGNNPVGVEIRLNLKKSDDEAAGLRPDDRDAEIRTRVCFPPQLRVKP